MYQGTLSPWANPLDPASFSWKLTSVAMSPDTRTELENVGIDNEGTITIPDIAYYGTHYTATLSLFKNPSDAANAYWRLESISAKE